MQVCLYEYVCTFVAIRKKPKNTLSAFPVKATKLHHLTKSHVLDMITVTVCKVSVLELWWGVEYPFIAITPRSILIQSGSTCKDHIYVSKRFA